MKDLIVYPNTGATIVGGVVGDAPAPGEATPTPVPEAYSQSVTRPMVAHPDRFTADDLNQAREHIVHLQDALTELTKDHGKVITDRDAWKARATTAERLYADVVNAHPELSLPKKG